MTAVAIIDDHHVLADLLALALRERDVDDVRVIAPGSDPLAELRDAWPDLCLLDLDLGEMGGEGLALLPELAANGVTTVIFTGATEPATLGRCLEIGALGVISKSTPFSQVVDAIRVALAGGEVNNRTQLYEWVMASSRQRAERARVAAPFETLTQREAEVLGALVRGRLVEEIARTDHVSERTVRTQIRAIFQKLGVRSQIAAVALAHDAGWKPPTCAPETRAAS